MTELGTVYPATTLPPAAAPGMVVHSLIDISMYAGSELDVRYHEGETDSARTAILANMPDATVTFVEVPEGEELFELPPVEFLDHLAELDRLESEEGWSPVECAEPA